MPHLVTLFFAISLLLSSSVYALTLDNISAQYLINKQLSKHIQIIDCRSSNHYNGWPLADGSEGGHFPGAINIDSQWLALLNDTQLQQLIQEKQLQQHKKTFLYCDNKASNMLSHALQKQGFKHVSIINSPLSEANTPLNHLPNFKQLVPPQWLNAVINQQQVLYAPSKDYKVIEVNWGPPLKYMLSHIPGAQYLNSNDIESEPWWNRVSDKELTQLLKKLGVRFDTTVILYGRNNIAAARAANILMYAGVNDVRLLNGGWQAWINAELSTEAFSNSNIDPVEFGKMIPANPHYIIDIDQAKAILKKDPLRHSLVSIRTWHEYTGKTSGYSYIKPKGRIVGSKWGHAGSDANNVSDFLNPDGSMKSARDIQHLWKDSNITSDQQVAFYCGTGWRAAEVFFYSYVMGWKNISVFDGGWYQWSADKNNPTSSATILKPGTNAPPELASHFLFYCIN